jgi:hypothetical protein
MSGSGGKGDPRGYEPGTRSWSGSAATRSRKSYSRPAIAVVAIGQCCYPGGLFERIEAGRADTWCGPKGGCAVSEVSKGFRQRRFCDLPDRDSGTS